MFTRCSKYVVFTATSCIIQRPVIKSLIQGIEETYLSSTIHRIDQRQCPVKTNHERAR